MQNRLPVILITGASGFVGRNLLDELKNEYRIFAIARRSQRESHAPEHPNIAWMRTDITDFKTLETAFREVKTAGGADLIFHLAAFYEFAGENNPHYIKTNVEGTRNVLELSKTLNPKLFVFTSSVAACSFPKPGQAIDESYPPDGEHIYAWSKRQGEEMIRAMTNSLNSCIVRLGAVYSDWCEYPPLYMFFNSWLSKSLRSAMLAGKGESAIPYIHIRDIIAFFRALINNYEKLKSAQILNACTNGSTSHKTLFELSTRYFYGKGKKPLYMPRVICGLGLHAMNIWGHITKNYPFERPWMRHYIDLKLDVNSSKTSELLSWEPNPRHLIERRIPFMVERLKSEPNAWHVRNQAAMRRDPSRPDLLIYTALSNIENQLIPELAAKIREKSYAKIFPNFQKLPESELFWFVKLVYRLLLTSVHSSNRMLILNYFEMSASNRFEAGYTPEEINKLLEALNLITIEHLKKIEEIKPLENNLYSYVTTPLEFGIDEVEQQYQIYKYEMSARDRTKKKEPEKERQDISARELLEETIWNCLVHRK